jgi:hypothetical protein
VGRMEHGLGRSIPLLSHHPLIFAAIRSSRRSNSLDSARSPGAWRLARPAVAILVLCLVRWAPPVSRDPSLGSLRLAAPILTPGPHFFLLPRRCEHYRRRCKIVAPCCKEVFPCRHCHNDATVRYWFCFALLNTVACVTVSLFVHVGRR